MTHLQNINSCQAMAKLNLPDNEQAWISGHAEKLTAGFTALDGIDTVGLEPLVTVLEAQNVLREDASAKMLPREELLANAPEQYDGYFQVPKTL